MQRNENRCNMKPSGIEWIGGIPADWVVSKVKYACDIIMGQSPDSSEVNDINGRYQFMQGNAEFTDLYPNPILFCDKPNKRSRVGDILMSVRAPVGEMNISDKVYGIGRGLCSIKPLRLFDKYFWYFMLKSKDDFSFYTNGSTFDAITTSNLLDFSVLLPPPKEQQAIAAFFDNQCDKIDGIIAEIERQIEVLKQYKTSLITETVTKGLDKSAPMKDSGIDWIGKIPAHWEVKRLKYIGSAKNGLTYTPEDTSDDGILVLRSSNIQEGKLAFEDNVYVDMEIPREIVIRENDILICSRNGSRELIGKCALIDNKTAGNTYGAFMCVFRSPYNRFIYYIFQSNIFDYYLGNYLTSTINQLTNANLYNMKIPITFNKKEQLQIVDYLDIRCKSIDNIITGKRQSIETMRAYKKSLIYEYVTGKKRVKGYQ